ncbi:Ig-like domain-containing protein [Aliiglaciecola sp. 2_MG-2023]|uniref:Ig-like domain-containing protein n=1 Tax=unclassified Aliiglaciecola TaxID=2593648 RepID=UPI0026E3FAA2|nr:MULTISPECIES: Ig-like domain-containing protein [unclassified Aliiglaciecola]MDO6710661.1 Ig-like domain-containing protein [Aliiglaciecola sp. 2_MG-2023]MDO6751931.1 Ig-like domain-containing protein [Aliiglaciecola sp. 1_MG-2023]
MKEHLLKNTLITVSIAGFLTGCGGTEEGYDSGFKAQDPVVISMPEISASLTEETGIQEIDLLEGATAGGEPLNGNINISDLNFSVDQNYLTPDVPSGGVANQRVSPFTEKNGKLIVDTDMFSDFLSTCDDTDRRGGPRVDGSPTPDGFLDSPPVVTYTIDFAVDNGFKLQPGESLPRRTLTLDVNAVFDGVVGITAQPARILLGQEFKLFATVLPEKACAPEVGFEVADTDIATIDAQGNVTTKDVGQTTITVTSLDDPSKAITVDLEVYSEFIVAITNKDTDENGLETDMKEIPACVSAGFDVSPTPAAGESLSGNYAYTWESSNNNDFPLIENISYGEKGSGRFSTGDETNVGDSFTATVGLASGDTGTTALANVEAKLVTATIVKNEMCEPGISAHPAGFNSDFLLDFSGAKWVVASGGASGGAVAQSDIALSGNSVEITSSTEDFTGILQGVFNKQRNWASATYGLGTTSIGNTYRFAVWVKLQVVPDTEIRVDHTLLPWTYEGGPSGPGYNLRRPGAGIMSATLKPTTEWQLLEFTDANGNREWTVPAIWNVVTDVFVTWDVYGLPAGETILLDEYSVIKVN